MTIHFKETKESLPSIIPIMPLYGSVLLPNSQLPIPLSEKEYYGSIYSAIQKYGFIGIIQPKLPDTNENYPVQLFKTGCVGKISDVKELRENDDDDKIICILTGLSRFDIIDEIHTSEPYRCAIVDYSKYYLDSA